MQRPLWPAVDEFAARVAEGVSVPAGVRTVSAAS